MRKVVVLTVGLLALASLAQADGPETGLVSGEVTDANGGALPGVSVTLEGNRGSKTVMTGDDGTYHFALLPPGSYTVRAQLEGFQTAESLATVAAGSKVQLNLKLVLETAETITVLAEAPLIDRFEVTSGATVETEVGKEVTTANASYYAIVAVMPGVSQDGDLGNAYPTVNGSRWMESSVFIDGVDTTYSRRGGSRIYIPDVATTEVTLQSGGGGAEFGRAVGSTTNVITKSGTNRFHGEGSVLRQEGGWNSEFARHPELEVRETCRDAFADAPSRDPRDLNYRPSCFEDFFIRDPREKDTADTTLQTALGGPILRDKAWFFASFAQIDTFSTRQTFSGDIVDNSADVDSYVAKVNFQPGPEHSLAASYIGTPLRVDFILPNVADRYGSTVHDFGGELVSATWNWTMSRNFFLETKLAQHESDENKFLSVGDGTSVQSAIAEKQLDPRYPAQPELGRFNPGNNYDAYFDRLGEDHQWNGWALDNGFGLNQYPRDQFNTKLNWFASKNHDVLFGVDWQQVKWDQDLQHNDWLSGPVFDAFTATGFESCGTIIGDICVWRDLNPADLAGLVKTERGTLSENLAFFVRDRFTVGDHWAFNVGVRFEDQSHENDAGRTVIDSTDVGPRFQASYDVKGDGKMLVSVNTGRTYQHIGQDITNQFLVEGWNGTNAWDRYLYCDSLDARFIAGCGGEVGYSNLIARLRPGIMWQQVDAGLFSVDIEPYYKDEIVAGFEWNFSRNWIFDAKGIYYELGNSIGTTEQALPNGDIFLLTENYKDYPRILEAIGVVDPEVLANFEEGSREYRSLQLQLNRRFRKGWALYNNVTLQDGEGHFFGGLFDNTSSDYGRNLEGVLTQAHIDRCTSVQENRSVPVDCVAALTPHLGEPLSTINRFGTLRENHGMVIKSFGFKNWDLGQGKHSLSLGGFFQWEGGKPWQRTESLEVATACDRDVVACSPEQNVFGDNVTVFLEARGSRSGFNSLWELDLFGTWSFPIHGELTGQVRLEANNVTDRQHLQRISSRGEVSTSRIIGWQQPRSLRILTTVRF